MDMRLTSLIRQKITLSIDIDQQVAKLDPLAPFVLGIHGVTVLLLMGGEWWQWGAMGSMLLLGAWGWSRWGQSQQAIIIRVSLIFGLTWLLSSTNGGVNSFFILWYFILVAVYPMALPSPFNLILLGAVPLSYLLLWPLSTQPVSLLNVLTRSFLLSFLGWLIWSLEATLMRYALKQEQSERRLAMAIEAAGLVVYEFSIPLDDTYYHSDRWADILGYELAELPSQSEQQLEWILHQVHPDDVVTMRQGFTSFVEGRTPSYQYETRIKHKSGRWIWINGYAVALKRNENGQSTRVLGMMQDITQRKQAEQELHVTQSRLAGIIDSAMDAIVAIDAEQRIVLFNTSAEKMFGLPANEALNQPLDRLIPERFQHIHRQHIEAFGQAKITNRRMNERYITGLRANGEEFSMEASISQTRIDDQPLYTAILRDISERVQVEAELHYQANLLENVSEAIISTDLNFVIQSWNKAAEEMYGWPTAEVIGKQITNVLPISYPDSDPEIVLSQFLQQGYWQGEVIQEHKNGTPIHILASTSIFKDREDQPVGIVSVNRDITKRKQGEEALRRSEQRLQLFVENAPAAIAVFDRDMCYITTSRRYVADYDLGDRTLAGRSHYDVFPSIPERWQEIYRRCLAGAIEKADEDTFPRADGKLDWIRWEIHPWYEYTDEIGGIIFFSEVITERKQVEEALKESQRLLREAQEYGRVGSWELDLVHNEFHLSDVFRDFHGLSRDTYTPDEMYHILFPQDRTQVDQAFDNALAGHGYDVTHRIYREDTHEVRWVHARGSLVCNESGKPLRIVGSSQDITERKNLEEQYYQSQKMEAIGHLAGGIAHDFNNILVPILGYAELSLMNLSPEEQLYTDLEHIRQAAERAATLTRQILAFSRKQVLQMHRLDLNPLITDFQKMLQRLIGENIILQTFLASELYPVKADKTQLEQVLLNLVINAHNAMPGGGTLTIETSNVYLDETYVQKHVGVQTPGHYVMLAVSDTGSGMDAKTQAQIFEPFFTTKERGKGTGLGLATVFGIVRQHQGYIWVYSELEQGTTFKVYLPQAEDTNLLPDTAPTLEPGSLHGTETVLVVEDEKMVRKLACETLEAYGYHVLEAKSTEHSLQLAANYKDRIHLLLTDVIMPYMNGRELYQKLLEFQPDIRVLYMSGYTDNVIVHHGILYEGINFLQKPFTILGLLQKVRTIL